MEIGYLPADHLHNLIDNTIPSMRWDGKADITEWQKLAREKLIELLGFAEIEPYKVKVETEVEYDRICEDMDCREIRFRFASEEGVTIPCNLLIPKNADKPLPVVICLQGHSTGMHISLGRPKFEGDENTISGGDRDFARRTVKEGFCALTLEQRGFGENGGDKEKGHPSCRMPAARALLIGRTLLGERVWDIMRCIDALELSFADIVDVDKVLCLGNSGGGTATTYASALDERIKISVPSCAVCRYVDSIAAMLHCECNYVPNISKFFDMGDLCAMIAPRPLVVVSGAHDTGFPIDGAKACVEIGKKAYEALGVADELVHVVGAEGHRFYADDAWPHVNAAIKKL